MPCVLCGWQTSLVFAGVRTLFGRIDDRAVLMLLPKHCRCNREALERKSSYGVIC